MPTKLACRKKEDIVQGWIVGTGHLRWAEEVHHVCNTGQYPEVLLPDHHHLAK